MERGDDKSNEERNEMRETETFVYFLLSSFCIFVMSVEKSNKKVDFCYLSNSTLYMSLKRCSIYGPRAKCGPKKLFTWPAKPTILII